MPRPRGVPRPGVWYGQRRRTADPEPTARVARAPRGARLLPVRQPLADRLPALDGRPDDRVAGAEPDPLRRDHAAGVHRPRQLPPDAWRGPACLAVAEGHALVRRRGGAAAGDRL